MNNTILLRKPSVEYLGVQIDQSLTWKDRITRITK